MAEKKTTSNFSADEMAAMKERAREAKLEAKRAKMADGKAADLADVLDKISKMAPADRAVAEQVHALVTAAAPHLDPKTWYGMPAYAIDGKAVCFFQDAGKFKARYNTFGFNDSAKLDDGTMWPTSFALTEITPAIAKQITELVKRAAS